MRLVRYKSNVSPEIVFEGTEKEVIDKIHELDLVDWHDAYFYKRDCFENMGLWGDDYDYYGMVLNDAEMLDFEKLHSIERLLADEEEIETNQILTEEEIQDVKQKLIKHASSKTKST